MTPLPEGVSDPYAILDLSGSASVKQIKKAYRLKALEIHPDKNPDDPSAEKNFHLLQAAYEFLLCPKSRAHYDDTLLRAKIRLEKFKQQSTEKQKFAEDLERRETTIKNPTSVDVTATVFDSQKRFRDETAEWCMKQAKEALKSKKIERTAGCLEIRWSVEVPPLSITKAAITFHLNQFSKDINFQSYDSDTRKAIVTLAENDKTLEAALHFLRNKEKYPFIVKFKKDYIKTPITKTTTTTTTTGATFEEDVLRRLKEANSNKMKSECLSEPPYHIGFARAETLHDMSESEKKMVSSSKEYMFSTVDERQSNEDNSNTQHLLMEEPSEPLMEFTTEIIASDSKSSNTEGSPEPYMFLMQSPTLQSQSSSDIYSTPVVHSDRHTDTVCVTCGEGSDRGLRLLACLMSSCRRPFCSRCITNASIKGVHLLNLKTRSCAICQYQSKQRPSLPAHEWHWTFNNHEDLDFTRALRDSLPAIPGLFLEIHPVRQACWRRRIGGVRKHYSFKQHGGFFEGRLQAIQVTSSLSHADLARFMMTVSPANYQGGPATKVSKHVARFTGTRSPQAMPYNSEGVFSPYLEPFASSLMSPLHSYVPPSSYLNNNHSINNNNHPNIVPSICHHNSTELVEEEVNENDHHLESHVKGEELVTHQINEFPSAHTSAGSRKRKSCDIQRKHEFLATPKKRHDSETLDLAQANISRGHCQTSSWDNPGTDSLAPTTTATTLLSRRDTDNKTLYQSPNQRGPTTLNNSSPEDEANNNNNYIDNNNNNINDSLELYKKEANATSNKFLSTTDDSSDMLNSPADNQINLIDKNQKNLSNLCDNQNNVNQSLFYGVADNLQSFARLLDGGWLSGAGASSVTLRAALRPKNSQNEKKAVENLEEPRCAICCEYVSRRSCELSTCQVQICSRVFCNCCIQEGLLSGTYHFISSTRRCAICDYQSMKIQRMPRNNLRIESWHMNFNPNDDITFLLKYTQGLPPIPGIWFDEVMLEWRTESSAENRFKLSLYGGLLEARWEAIQKLYQRL